MSFSPAMLAFLLGVPPGVESVLPGCEAAPTTPRLGEILGALHLEEFPEALRLAETLTSRCPEDPAGPLMEANVRQTRMRDYRLRDDEPAFLAALAQAESLAVRRVREAPSAESYFLLGSARGYKSIHLARQGRWLPALRGALRAVGDMKRARELEPESLEPLIPLALFDYWKGRKLPFCRGSKREAFERLERVWNSGSFLSVEAAYSLQTLRLLEGQPERALEVNEWLQARFPRNPVGLYHRALILERLNRGEEALTAWDGLVERLRESGRVSEGFLAECELHRSRGLAKAGRVADAKLALEQASLHARRRDSTVELEGPFVSFDDICQAIAAALTTPAE